MSVDFVSFFIIYAVLKCIACDVVNMKGISLIYIMSMARVTSPYSSSIPFGRLSSVLSTTFSEVFHVVFPYRIPRFGLIMSSARTMSSFMIGQFGIRSFSTDLI